MSLGKPRKIPMSYGATEARLQLQGYHDSGYVLEAPPRVWLAMCRDRMVDAKLWTPDWEELLTEWTRDLVHVEVKYTFVRKYTKTTSYLVPTDHVSYTIIDRQLDVARESKATADGASGQTRTVPTVAVSVSRGWHELDIEGGMSSDTFPAGSLQQQQESAAFAGVTCLCCCRSPIREQAKKDFFGTIENVNPKWHFGLFLLTFMQDLGWAWEGGFEPFTPNPLRGCFESLLSTLARPFVAAYQWFSHWWCPAT